MIKPVLYIFLFTLFASGFGVAQTNFVYNGGFEEYTFCPTSNELNNGQFERVKGWWRPTLSTPDYYNRCNNGIVGIPNNFWGSQEAFQGDGYSGFGAISWNANGENLGNEYFRTKLIEPLKPCVRYKLTMYVSLAEVSSHGIGDIGGWLSVENDYVSTIFSILQQPQIVHDGPPITDTLNWTKIEGEFIANGFESYLTIGYFRNSVESDTLFVKDFGPNIQSKEALYYVDNISLTELNMVPDELCNLGSLFPNIITPNGDHINDNIDISKYTGIIDEVIILNRWGNSVAILNEKNPIWDGSNLTDGIYYYLLIPNLGEYKKQTGFIQLVR